MYPTEAFSKPEAAQSWQVSAQSVAASHSWAYECTMADADMRRILSKNIFFGGKIKDVTTCNTTTKNGGGVFGPQGGSKIKYTTFDLPHFGF